MKLESKRSSCCSSHDTCNLARSNGSLPTRLLDVGNPRASFVKVQVTTPATTGEYLALSHCWGDPSDMATVLTNETFNEYITTGLAFELLPKTFQDAVLFTRSLGKRYLWIDSLCIIQNNADDWDREAATVCSVYQGALLTIAAASSSSGRGGLLYEPPTHRITRTTPNGPYTLFGRESIRHKEKEYPLLTRGWASQERLLSPRTLYFGSKELLWERRGSRTCQCGESVSSHIGGDVSKVYQTTTAGAASLDGGRLISGLRLIRGRK